MRTTTQNNHATQSAADKNTVRPGEPAGWSEARRADILGSAANDMRLSCEAIGLLAYMLYRPEGWKCREADLREWGGIGRCLYQRLMRELREAGYVDLRHLRDQAGVRLRGRRLVLVDQHPGEAGGEGSPRDGASPARRRVATRA